MELVLLVLYIILLVFDVILLIDTARKPAKSKWLTLFISEAAFALLAVGVAFAFNSLPGTGMMPGLTYFAHVIFSICASLAFTVAFAVSAIVYIILKIKNKNMLGGKQE